MVAWKKGTPDKEIKMQTEEKRLFFLISFFFIPTSFSPYFYSFDRKKFVTQSAWMENSRINPFPSLL